MILRLISVAVIALVLSGSIAHAQCGCASSPPVATSYLAPSYASNYAPVAYEAPVSYTSYYAPVAYQAPVSYVSYYAPPAVAAPVPYVSYYAPAVPYTSYYT